MAGCITVTVYHSGSGGSAIIGYKSSSLDGQFAEGNQAFGWGGMGTPTDAEYLSTVAIPGTIQYLGAKWLSLYGVPMTTNDICGQGVPPGSTGDNKIIVLVAILIALYLIWKR